MTKIFMFDVESDGLHGNAFAVGWAYWDGKVAWAGRQLFLKGYQPQDPWVRENVPSQDTRYAQGFDTPLAMRNLFWYDMRFAIEEGYEIWADCAWPVEANFLSACIEDDPGRAFKGPYPLKDMSTIVPPDVPREAAIDQKQKHVASCDALASLIRLLHHQGMREVPVQIGCAMSGAPRLVWI